MTISDNFRAYHNAKRQRGQRHRAEAVRLRQQGLSPRAIANRTGQALTTVYSHLRAELGNTRGVQMEADMKQAQRLANQDVPLEDIAERLDISVAWVTKLLKRTDTPYITRAQHRRQERYQQALKLYMKGLPIDSIAKQLGCKPPSVYSLLPRHVRRRSVDNSTRVYPERKRPKHPSRILSAPLILTDAIAVRAINVQQLYDQGYTLPRAAEQLGISIEQARAALRKAYTSDGRAA